jgi:hypothetical protein
MLPQHRPRRCLGRVTGDTARRYPEPMRSIVVLTDTGTTTVDALVDQGEVRVAPAVLDTLFGWHLEPQGMCRGDVCIPLPAEARPGPDGLVDLPTLASLLGRPSVADPAAGVVAVGVERDTRRRALRDLALPDFTLPDLDGRPVSSTSWRDRKHLVLAFSSW